MSSLSNSQLNKNYDDEIDLIELFNVLIEGKCNFQTNLLSYYSNLYIKNIF